MNTGRTGLADWARAAWKAAKVAWKAVASAKGAAKNAFRAEMRLARDTRIVRASPLFDAGWYLKNNPDVAASGMDPARHYAQFGVASNRNPSPNFTNEEYFDLHYDVRAAKVNPLVHFEMFGRREGRPVSHLETAEPVFPGEAVEGTWRFGRAVRKHGRTAIVASYFGKGTLPDALLVLLRGLREVVDDIVYVADCPVLPAEVEKLRGIVSVARFARHGQYDFGSYRRGLEIARAEGFLDAAAAGELVVMNDSNYGPVYPFSESFDKMAARPCDFWGMTPYRAMLGLHLQSFFYVFRRKVIESGALDEFLSRVQGRFERDKVIVLFELRFTKFLSDRGFAWDSVVPQDILSRGSPMKFPLTLCTKYRMPLIKVKAVNGDSYEDTGKLLDLVAKVNPELRAAIAPRPAPRAQHLVTYAGHQASFPARCARIAAKIRAGGKARAVFFVTSASMFPARPLFDAMLADGAFDPFVVVVPDLRWHDGAFAAEMAACRDDLSATVPGDRLSVATQDEFGSWADVLEGADIVCYPSPYELSSYRYNPRYAVGRGFLPICANYGYYRSVYDREVMGSQSYAWMWKAFFECAATADEYRTYSAIGGTNVDVVGYVKMDRLAAVVPEPHERRRVLVALHHSVEGGTNKMLSLANFVRYADFFLALPDRHPEIDFVFRPHPFLIKVMSRPDQWGAARTARYFGELKAKPNVVWSEGGDYFRAFAESDACIQDCGSYLVEYFYTKKPCCYMLHAPDDIDAKFAPLGKECLANCYLAYDTAAIERFVSEVVVGGNDPMKPAREAFAGKVMVNYPHAAEVALEHVKADIKKAAGLQ